jgi:hypothetical protein
MGCRLVFLMALLHTSLPAQAQSILEATHLLDVRQGSARSSAVRNAGFGGYELTDGTPVSFRNWYQSAWKDLHVDFLTQVDEHTGFIWGFSTGEGGDKYRITPGVKLGLVHEILATRTSTLSITATVQLGSDLRERSCTADYGDLGGVQEVNCRLAASQLPPAETLKYRLGMRGIDDSRIQIAYQLRF